MTGPSTIAATNAPTPAAAPAVPADCQAPRNSSRASGSPANHWRFIDCNPRSSLQTRSGLHRSACRTSEVRVRDQRRTDPNKRPPSSQPRRNYPVAIIGAGRSGLRYHNRIHNTCVSVARREVSRHWRHVPAAGLCADRSERRIEHMIAQSDHAVAARNQSSSRNRQLSSPIRPTAGPCTYRIIGEYTASVDAESAARLASQLHRFAAT
jgi:hypothetical protein